LEQDTTRLPEKLSPPTPFPGVRKAFSELPFASDPAQLGNFNERGPLLHVFSFALMSWLTRQSWIGRAARIARMMIPMSRRFVYHGPHAAECGIFQGHSLRACMEISERMRIPVTFFGFDTFVGFPPLSRQDRAAAPESSPYLRRKLFTNTSTQEVYDRLIADMKFSQAVLFEGLFADTFPRVPTRKFFFVNVDCDLYQSHVEALHYFYPRMEKHGIIYFDDYHSLEYPMARLAIDEFLADKPELLWHLRYGEGDGNMTKSFLIKA
jgi:hypothetical protein